MSQEKIKEQGWAFGCNCVAIAMGWLQTGDLPALVSLVLGF